MTKLSLKLEIPNPPMDLICIDEYRLELRYLWIIEKIVHIKFASFHKLTNIEIMIDIFFNSIFPYLLT